MSDEQAQDALRRARRAVAKATHPDHGGDAETHRKAMEALESAGAPQPTNPLAAVRKRLRTVAALPRDVKSAFKDGLSSDPADNDPSA